jgi:hypothetical protein
MGDGWRAGVYCDRQSVVRRHVLQNAWFFIIVEREKKRQNLHSLGRSLWPSIPSSNMCAQHGTICTDMRPDRTPRPRGHPRRYPRAATIVDVDVDDAQPSTIMPGRALLH